MAWTQYRSTDASAPALSGTAGSFKALLKACLVDGYGSKPAAGWSVAYDGVNVVSFRMATTGGALGHYLYVDDTGTSTCRWIGCETMSSITDITTTPFPTTGQVAGGLYVRKSSTADAVARPWVVFANERLVFVWVFSAQTALGSTAATDSTLFFGQGESLVAGDLYNTFAIGAAGAGSVENAATCLSAVASAATTGHYLCRNYSQIGSSTTCGKIFYRLSSHTGATLGVDTNTPSTVNPITSAFDMSPIMLGETAAATVAARLVIPKMFAMNHNSFGTYFDTISGAGTLTGRSFIIMPVYSSATVGRLIIETT